MTPEVRIDKYLWSIRVFKTRSEAAEACKTNKVYVNGTEAKSSRSIKEGDIILAVDDLAVDTLCELRSILFSKSIGEKMRVKIFSDGEEKQIVVAVSENRKYR